LPVPARSGRRKRVFWERLLARRPLGVDIVDAHAHLGGSGGYVLEENDLERQVALALAAMNRLGIKTMIASGMEALLGSPVKGNELLEKSLAPHAGRLLGYVSFNPFYARELLPRLDRYFAGKVFVGFKLLCDYWKIPVTDPRFTPMWQYADRRRLPVLIHTWQSSFDAPALLKPMVRQYPRIAFLLGHSGGNDAGRQQAEELAAENSNVHLEWCGSFCGTRRWEDTLKQVPLRQIVFGTDAVAHGIPWELGRLLSLDIPDKILAPILGANLRRILRQAAPG
jgi:predicted TIM-barrel fold metal-dependent hydrolase